MKKVFNYMFMDPAFKQKALKYFVFLFIANFLCDYSHTFAQINAVSVNQLIFKLLGGFVMLITSGYGILCIKSIFEQKENIVLPFLNVKNCLVTGFKMFISLLIMSLLLFIIYIVPTCILKLLTFIQIPNAAISNVFLIIITILSILFYIILFAAIVYFPMALTAIFAKTEGLKSFIRIAKAYKLIKSSGRVHYLKNLILLILLTILVAFIKLLLITFCGTALPGIIVTALVMSLIGSYTVFVSSYITAKAVNHELI